MYIRVVKDPRAVSSTTTALLTDEGGKVLKQRETYNLVLPTGSTPVETYRELIRRYRAGEISLDLIARTRTWNLDEYLPDTDREVWRYHEQSYWLFMRRHLFGHVTFANGANHIPNPAAVDLEAECRGYDESIATQGGPDVVLVGIGTNGHVAFNEPPAQKDSPTRVVGLAQTTVSDNAKKFFGGDLDAVPKQALSMGFRTILSGRKLVLIATGYAKAVTVGASVLGPVTGWCPASFLQEHPDCTCIIDTEAASIVLEYAKARGHDPRSGRFDVRSEAGYEHSVQTTNGP